MKFHNAWKNINCEKNATNLVTFLTPYAEMHKPLPPGFGLTCGVLTVTLHEREACLTLKRPP